MFACHSVKLIGLVLVLAGSLNLIAAQQSTTTTGQSNSASNAETAAGVNDPVAASPGTKSDIVVTSPTATTEWHAQSENSIGWTGTSPSVFSFQIVNDDHSVLADGLSLGNNIPVTAKKDTFMLGSVEPAPKYRVRLYDIRNESVELVTKTELQSDAFTILAKVHVNTTDSQKATSNWNGLGADPNKVQNSSSTASSVPENGAVSTSTDASSVANANEKNSPSTSSNQSTTSAATGDASNNKNTALTSSSSPTSSSSTNNGLTTTASSSNSTSGQKDEAKAMLGSQSPILFTLFNALFIGILIMMLI